MSIAARAGAPVPEPPALGPRMQLAWQCFADLVEVNLPECRNWCELAGIPGSTWWMWDRVKYLYLEMRDGR